MKQFSISGSQLPVVDSQFSFNPKQFSEHTRSFLKVQDGCDKNCTYCRIRLARGPSISLEPEEVLSRLRILEESHAEVVLTGVNICQYSYKINSGKSAAANNLTGLLEYLLSGTQKAAIRLSSLSPDSVDEDLARVLSHKRIRPHFHLSIQSGSGKIIEKMGRGYNAEAIEKAVSLLRRVKNDPFLACDIITGFPGEGEAEFLETFELCKKTDFAWIHVFPYSKRPDTPAFSFTDTVAESEITKRVQLFTDLAWKGRKSYVQRWLGSEVDVLVETNNKGQKLNNDRQSCHGVSENYLKVVIQKSGAVPLPGQVLRCRLLGTDNLQEIKGEELDVIAEAVNG